VKSGIRAVLLIREQARSHGKKSIQKDKILLNKVRHLMQLGNPGPQDRACPVLRESEFNGSAGK